MKARPADRKVFAERLFAGVPLLPQPQPKSRRDFPATLGEGDCEHQTAGADGDRDADGATNETLHAISPVAPHVRLRTHLAVAI
jgi:hypothetical protein